ncbi:hypothetical protein VSH64_07920 [Amycolatopsis rhabdoformis]|uniref:Uncharacterized protein n=1 Tax=Amycolatopsis rhabdoformis TaxID=1448059 RepID=A0ABZ1ID95_9PSEU|nr:hypothetical protein [Amycolatopsis rhabdoformis]WSE32034.1 hypothetical protein VSH64_07920 [Amycolatopsis rhabdoformis]
MAHAERAEAGQRVGSAARQRFRRGVGHFLDLDQRPRGQVLEHRLGHELLDAADFREHDAVLFTELLERVGDVAGRREAERFGVVRAVEHGEHRRFQAGVDVRGDPVAAVARRVEAQVRADEAVGQVGGVAVERFPALFRSRGWPGRGRP